MTITLPSGERVALKALWCSLYNERPLGGTARPTVTLEIEVPDGIGMGATRRIRRETIEFRTAREAAAYCSELAERITQKENP